MATTTAAEEGTFTLQVLSHSVGIAEMLSFPGLPVHTTVAQLKTKIKEEASLANADEESQRLIYHGRILANGDQTMNEVFGADTLKNYPTQSLHLSIRPRADDNLAPTPTIPLPVEEEPAFVVPPDMYEFYPPDALPATARTTHPHLFPAPAETRVSPEEQSFDTAIQGSASSEAARAYATQRLDINSLHHANNHAVDAATHLQNMQALNAPQSVRESARTGLQVALENQYQAWQRAYLNSIQNERHMLSQPSASESDTTLRHALRMGIEYLEAEDRLASSRPSEEQPGQESPTLQRDLALQRYHLAAMRANIATGMPPTSLPHVSVAGPRRGSGDSRQARRMAAQAAAMAAQGDNEPLPVLGHGPNVRPLAAGILAAFVPHLWSIFKLGVFIYAFTRMDNSWARYVMVCMVGLGIFLYNIGVLPVIWQVVLNHIHGILPMDEVPMPENGQAAPGAAGGGANDGAVANAARPEAGPRRRSRREPTPERYAARILARNQREARDRAHANRSALHNTLRTIEHDILLFFFSIVPGVAERHIAARNSEVRARQREREHAEGGETPGQEQEARDQNEAAEAERREGAVAAAAVEAARQEREENRFGAGQRLGGAAVPRPAAVEDDVFGGVD